MNKANQVTLDDIAAKAGVSVAAVSQALSGKGRISEATRARVFEVVEQLSYQPDRAAQSLARRRASRVERTDVSEEPVVRGRRKRGGDMVTGLLHFLPVEEANDVLGMELRQLHEEGRDVSAPQAAYAALRAGPLRRSRLTALLEELADAPARSDFPYHEPASLEEIRAARPDGPRGERIGLTKAVLEQRTLGAWQGRVAGCVLGRPVESGWSKSQMLEYLRLAGSLPLDNYIPRLVSTPSGLEPNPSGGGAFRDEIGGAPADDDTDFTILAGHILEEYGLAFTTADVATEWLSHLTYFNVYTAERATYRNLTLSVPPAEAALMLNPAREFIGARIRADMYGMVCPGLPELAAELAYRDAILSHTRNGVYAAMFMAATLAWCYVASNVQEAIRVGLSEIPARCRLAETVRDVLACYEELGDWETVYDRLILKLGAYHPVHAINNTAWLVLALLAGGGDFDTTLATAIMCGMDTDCNAANAGAVVGLLRGPGAIAPKWTTPLVDSLRSLISGCPDLPISEGAARTARLAERTLLTR